MTRDEIKHNTRLLIIVHQNGNIEEVKRLYSVASEVGNHGFNAKYDLRANI